MKSFQCSIVVVMVLAAPIANAFGQSTGKAIPAGASSAHSASSAAAVTGTHAPAGQAGHSTDPQQSTGKGSSTLNAPAPGRDDTAGKSN